MKLFERLLAALAYPMLALVVMVPAMSVFICFFDPFKTGQEVLLVGLCWVFALVVLLLRLVSGRPALPPLTAPARIALLLIPVWMALTCGFGYNPAMAWRYYASVLAYFVFAVALLGWIEDRPIRRSFVMVMLAIWAAWQTLVCLLEIERASSVLTAIGNWLPISPGTLNPVLLWIKELPQSLALIASGSPFGTLGNINYMGEFLALVLPPLLGWVISWRSKWGRVAAIAAMLPMWLVFLETECRAAVVGVAVGGVVAAGLAFGWRSFDPRTWWRNDQMRSKLGLAAWIGGLVALLTSGHLLQKVSQIQTDGDTLLPRWLNWRAALEIALSHPIVGVGVGAFKLTNTQAIVQTFPAGIPAAATQERFLDAHNEPLQTFVEQGLPGLLLILAVFVLWIRDVRRNPTLSSPQCFGILWGILALVLASFFGFPFHIPQTALAVMIVLMLGLASAEPEERRLPGVWGPSLAIPAAVLYVLVAGQVFWKMTWPNFVAHEEMFVARNLILAHQYSQADKVLPVVDRLIRFKDDVRMNMLLADTNEHRYQQVLNLVQASDREGLGIEQYYWQGLAYEAEGRTSDALACYVRIVRYFDDTAGYYKLALSRIRAINGAGAAAGETQKVERK